MHELSVCQDLIRQVEKVAAAHGAAAVERIVLQIGELSGVEPPLLERAFTVARAGTVAAAAEMEIRTGPVVVLCKECGGRSAVPANRLVCTYCGDWRVRVVEGEELLLLSIELDLL
jgi:hydrogenase nickel incorporation protein HypA/HybF